ncbi:unnamed protein product [Hermetia illucens]|uniref:SAP domain-containing protein n=1 Tax=Hermetia illucens TaxID=343691 RepID=A0A7R8Z0V1_HERIL|nr:SAP domain-containing ribonucleoprotein [Hermetia illucens]CAD7093009.1 unnamed protein product [Hermetia illucens]
MAENDVLKMKVADLKRELKLRGCPTTGNKNELQERLQTALLAGDTGDFGLEDTSITEDLLDEALTDEDEKGLDLSNEDAVLQSPDKDEDKSIATTIAGQQQQKKIVLKRKTSISLPSNTSASATSPTLPDSKPPEKISKTSSPSEASTTNDKASDGAKTVIKLSELSMKDRLEMRAKKFGTAASADTAKLARAARFGQSTNAESITSASSATSASTSIDTLKKRAERFGCSVSSRMVQLERKEKLMKRQERFGAGKNDSDNSTTSSEPKANGTSATVDYAEKAKQRLERFKTAVK